MEVSPLNVMFLCTGNSARSILAEAILNRAGKGRFRAFSAGSRPTGQPNPLAIGLLREKGYDVSFARSKSWDEFAGPDAPKLDFIVTVCDSAAAETCPIWPGRPVSAHWGLPDPAGVIGDNVDRMQAFAATYLALTQRIAAFVALPVAMLDPKSLDARLQEIGGMPK